MVKRTNRSSPKAKSASAPHADATAPRTADQLGREIGERISRARQGLGLSQQALHHRTKMADPEDVGISRAVLSLYERGVNKPGAREICLLCDVLKVTPNWLLYGAEAPARPMQASLDWTTGSDFDLAVRLSLAILAMDRRDRDVLLSLSLSLLEKKLGDIKLSGLMAFASLFRESLVKDLRSVLGKESDEITVEELIATFVKDGTEGYSTNWGTLRPPVEDSENFDPNSDLPPPPRQL